MSSKTTVKKTLREKVIETKGRGLCIIGFIVAGTLYFALHSSTTVLYFSWIIFRSNFQNSASIA